MAANDQALTQPMSSRVRQSQSCTPFDTGAEVIATASAGDLDRVRELGAAQAIDFRATPFETAAKNVDAVIDLVGGETLDRSFAVLKPGGVLVSAVAEPDQARATEHGVRVLFMLVN